MQNYMMSSLGKGNTLAQINQANNYELMSTPSHFQRMMKKHSKISQDALNKKVDSARRAVEQIIKAGE